VDIARNDLVSCHFDNDPGHSFVDVSIPVQDVAAG
jgi:hypothetical protein